MSEIYRSQPHRVDHIVDRHLLSSNYEQKGDCFPGYIDRSVIKYFCDLLVRSLLATLKDKAVEGTEITSYYQRENGSYKVKMRLKPTQYGVKVLEGVVHQGQVITLYPLRSSGNSNLWRNGKPTKKVRKFSNYFQ